ncbi:MAG: hypothetical protein US91_C0008G0094 [Candidatus Falkowbacteria bacterium GW2011_GWE1_38_31]|uniref:Uncharacterized protein n=1 Tax=Candidatus Falkowbacteria bacterium GW2011_GWE1_38_31 TaxID=1618638 RepID=A0A0G0M8G8_9BACT|nr:MAG: hypothetical protein US87_C0008G0093 [Candidatus Falkowbacteria bacterium GW2011_GWE2_38_254]KKQ69974.1 MAG: hypothetical protein US91_C0008G0094 [Candidatus Falkowbacteria bacterium GW2011_GWE1_38_31]
MRAVVNQVLDNAGGGGNRVRRVYPGADGDLAGVGHERGGGGGEVVAVTVEVGAAAEFAASRGAGVASWASVILKNT